MAKKTQFKTAATIVFVSTILGSGFAHADTLSESEFSKFFLKAFGLDPLEMEIQRREDRDQEEFERGLAGGAPDVVVSASAEAGGFTFSFDRHFLATELPIGFKIPAITETVDLEGWTVGGSVGLSWSEGWTDKPIFIPESVTLSGSYMESDETILYSATPFINGLGVPTVGEETGAFYRTVVDGVRQIDSADLLGATYEVDYTAHELELSQSWLTTSLGTNGAFQFGTGARYIGEMYEESFAGSLAFPGFPATQSDFSYHTDLDSYTFGAFANVQVAFGAPVITGGLDGIVFAIAGAELGLNRSELDGTDTLIRAGFAGDFSAQTDLSDDEWRASAGANFGVGFATSTGFSVFAGVEVDYGKYANINVDRPDSTDAGAVLPSTAIYDDPNDPVVVGVIRSTFSF
ncbi:MAG: hypothetical protein AAGH60_09995 [Pseudomonadota bacterium]